MCRREEEENRLEKHKMCFSKKRPTDLPVTSSKFQSINLITQHHCTEINNRLRKQFVEIDVPFAFDAFNESAVGSWRRACAGIACRFWRKQASAFSGPHRPIGLNASQNPQQRTQSEKNNANHQPPTGRLLY